jgi:hypothetical protein
MKRTFCLLSLLLLGACGGATMNIGVGSPTISRPDLKPFDLYRAAKLSLRELGNVDEESADRGLVQGRIPPFQIKAVVERGTSNMTIVGLAGGKGEWTRDSVKKEWFLVQDGKERRTEGAKSLAEAVDLWHKAILDRL